VNRADKVATCPLACCVLRERISRVCAVYSSVASRPRSPRVGCRNCDAMKAVRTKLKKEPLALSALRRPRAAPATWARSGQPGAQPRRVAAAPRGRWASASRAVPGVTRGVALAVGRARVRHLPNGINRATQSSTIQPRPPPAPVASRHAPQPQSRPRGCVLVTTAVSYEQDAARPQSPDIRHESGQHSRLACHPPCPLVGERGPTYRSHSLGHGCVCLPPPQSRAIRTREAAIT
jgi:hypothetical protein